MNETGGASKAERKKARRRARKASESSEAKRIDDLATGAIEAALKLAPEVAAANSQESSERAIHIEVSTIDAARFVRKRVNEALAYEEWLDAVEAWVWEAETSVRPPLTDHGAAHGVELRLEQVSRERFPNQ